MEIENDIYIEEQIAEADKLYNEGEYIECKRHLIQLLEQEPGCGKAHHILACLYFYNLDDCLKAVEHFKHAIRFSPTYPAAFMNYLRVLNYLNRHQELVVIAAQAKEVEGMNLCFVSIEEGKSFEKNKLYGKALHCFEEAGTQAIQSAEVDEVKNSIKRLKNKRIQAFKKKWLFN